MRTPHLTQPVPRVRKAVPSHARWFIAPASRVAVLLASMRGRPRPGCVIRRIATVPSATPSATSCRRSWAPGRQRRLSGDPRRCRHPLPGTRRAQAALASPAPPGPGRHPPGARQPRRPPRQSRPHRPHPSFDSYYDVILPRTAYLASPRTDRTFELDAHAATAYRSELVFPVDRPGRLTGFKGWFVADCHRRSPSTSPATASTAAPPPARQPMEDPRSPQPARGQPAPAARSSPIRSALVG
jgi:hypothetical protein